MRKQNRHRKIDKRKSMNRHHLLNKCKGGKNQDWNIVLIDIEKHRYWHKIFKNLSLEEVIELLKRLKRLKDFQRFKRASPP